MNPLFRIDFSISDSLKIVRKSVLIYETIIILLSHNRLEMEIKIKMVLMLNNMEDIFLQLMRRW